MRSIAQLNTGPVARWRVSLTVDKRWPLRRLAYRVVVEVLNGQLTPDQPAQRRRQEPTTPPASIVAVAAALDVPQSNLFAMFAQRDPVHGRSASPRLAAEAVLDSFWSYREGLFRHDMRASAAQLIAAYLRALASWGLNAPAVAACLRGTQPVLPMCVAEDLRALAHHAVPPRDTRPFDEIVAATVEAAHTVVDAVLDDRSMTPTTAYDLVRPDLEPFWRPEPAPVADAAQSTAFLVATASDIFGDPDPVLVQQARELRPLLTAFLELLTIDEPARRKGDER